MARVSRQKQASKRAHTERSVDSEAPVQPKNAVVADTPAPSYTLELDVHLFFTPLMTELGEGIILTRTLQLPFPPSAEIAIGGRSVEGELIPILGYRLQDIVWDVDRQVFVAETVCCADGDPIGFIPLEIASYLDNGWEVGSWRKHYDPDWESPIVEWPGLADYEFSWSDETELEELERKAPSARPEAFNRLFSALIKTLFRLRNNEAVAYAMYKTKRYFAEGNKDATANSTEFRKTEEAFRTMSGDERFRVSKRVLRSRTM